MRAGFFKLRRTSACRVAIGLIASSRVTTPVPVITSPPASTPHALFPRRRCVAGRLRCADHQWLPLRPPADRAADATCSRMRGFSSLNDRHCQ
jgi:hypothetical protein